MEPLDPIQLLPLSRWPVCEPRLVLDEAFQDRVLDLIRNHSKLIRIAFFCPQGICLADLKVDGHADFVLA